MLAIEPRRRLDIVAGDGGRQRPDILVFGGLLNEPAFKGRSTEPLVHTGGGQGRWGVQLTKKFVDVTNVSSRFRN